MENIHSFFCSLKFSEYSNNLKNGHIFQFSELSEYSDYMLEMKEIQKKIKKRSKKNKKTF